MAFAAAKATKAPEGRMRDREILYWQCKAVIEGKIEPFSIGKKEYNLHKALQVVRGNQRLFENTLTGMFFERQNGKQTNITN